MAEGFLRSFAPQRFEVQSAGTRATRVHPLAVAVMREAGVDISRHQSKSIDDVGEGWDVVVTVCDSSCPVPPRSGLKLRWKLPDPSAARGTEPERLEVFRGVRDSIKSRVRLLAARL
jgi:arsenate reductase